MQLSLIHIYGGQYEDADQRVAAGFLELCRGYPAQQHQDHQGYRQFEAGTEGEEDHQHEVEVGIGIRGHRDDVRLEAVSYTHLDVYKRQGYAWPRGWKPAKRW